MSEDKRNISYTAIILNEPSRKKLLNLISGLIPDDWRVIAHHVTINLGPAKPEMEDYLNTTIRLLVKSIGKSDMAMAVGVEILNPNVKSTNERPHVTIAVSPEGKPRMSNDIEKWYPINTRMYLSGKLEEVPFNIKENEKVSSI